MATQVDNFPDDCRFLNAEDKEYVDFSCQYRFLKPFYSSFEKGYEPSVLSYWMQERPFVPIGACLLYAALIFWGQRHFKEKPAWNWRRTMAFWNLSLSLFSWMGMIRTVPHLLHNISTLSIRDNVCSDPGVTWGSGSTGLWVQLFILSKFPELIDTFFIVIHKKPLIFLHWYHHVTVLLYCWHAYVSRSPYGLFFVAMNYSVHAVMYGYYFLMAVKLKPKWLNAMFITAAQISQMVVGVAVTTIAFYHFMQQRYGEKTSAAPCRIHMENNIAAFLMYGSYLFLFAQFFVKRYYKGKQMRNAKKAL